MLETPLPRKKPRKIIYILPALLVASVLVLMSFVAGVVYKTIASNDDPREINYHAGSVIMGVDIAARESGFLKDNVEGNVEGVAIMEFHSNGCGIVFVKGDESKGYVAFAMDYKDSGEVDFYESEIPVIDSDSLGLSYNCSEDILPPEAR